MKDLSEVTEVAVWSVWMRIPNVETKDQDEATDQNKDKTHVGAVGMVVGTSQAEVGRGGHGRGVHVQS